MWNEKVRKLVEIMTEHNTTYEAAASMLGLDKTSFCKKLENGGNFTIGELRKLVECVPLKKEEVIEIFFNH